ncbi:hypothetical protein [Sphaerisporangium perillae]|uniref:hypothetical protein n=1 Tax=Sphaerisporangium perillae TaxID=2935860 RepID=UPI00200F6D3C|nr:hypothetical protein [Sphaerisporangium perillae]
MSISEQRQIPNAGLEEPDSTAPTGSPMTTFDPETEFPFLTSGGLCDFVPPHHSIPV